MDRNTQKHIVVESRHFRDEVRELKSALHRYSNTNRDRNIFLTVQRLMRLEERIGRFINEFESPKVKAKT